MKISNLKLVAVIAASVVVLTGCTTFSKKECQNMDWNERGYQSALKGDTFGGALDYYQRECFQKHQVMPEEVLFQNGYDAGLKYVCTRSGGLSFGRRGHRYAGICPKETEKEFFEGYQVGRVEYMGDRIESLESEVSSLRREIDEKDSRIRQLEDELRRK